MLRELEFLNFGPWALVWTFLFTKAKTCAQNKDPYSKESIKGTHGLVLPHPWEMIHHQWPALVQVPDKGTHCASWKSKVPAAELPQLAGQELQHHPQPVAHAFPVTLGPWKKSSRMSLGTARIVPAGCTAWWPEPSSCTALGTTHLKTAPLC